MTNGNFIYSLGKCLPLCRPGLNGAIVPSDSAQPHMKETINNIQTKLDHLYNQTQVKYLHDSVLRLNVRTHM